LEDHDLSEGIRENFSPKKRWQSAFNAIRAAGRLSSFNKKGGMGDLAGMLGRKDTKDSGGWIDSDEEYDSPEERDATSPTTEKEKSARPQPRRKLSRMPGSFHREESEESDFEKH
jgi:calcium/calmodulin-dependent protein kinase I